MPSVNVFFTPTENFYASFGAYYANRSETFGELVDDPSQSQAAKSGAFRIGEAGPKWHQDILLDQAGNLKLGAWGHAGTFARFDGSRQQGTYGCYAILDQTLWQPIGEGEDGRGVRAFLEGGGTQQVINTINGHIGAGFTCTGLLESRPDDVIGFGPQYAHLSSQAGLPHSYELAIETFYQYQWTKWAQLQPDLQYIMNLGGKFPDALVATIRLSINF